MSSERPNTRTAPPIRPGSLRMYGNALIGRYAKRPDDAPLPTWFRVLDRFGVPAAVTTIGAAAALALSRWLGVAPCP